MFNLNPKAYTQGPCIIIIFWDHPDSTKRKCFGTCSLSYVTQLPNISKWFCHAGTIYDHMYIVTVRKLSIRPWVGVVDVLMCKKKTKKKEWIPPFYFSTLVVVILLIILFTNAKVNVIKPSWEEEGLTRVWKESRESLFFVFYCCSRTLRKTNREMTGESALSYC